MGICTKRHFLLSICVLQLLSTIERQIFDFLGFMWAPILANFFEIIFVIFGFFGAFQYRPKYIITYCVWNLLWIAWNAFIICFYLDVGILSKKSDLLNFGTGSFSWWLENGIGCKPVPLLNNYTEAFPNRPIRPEKVDNCLLDYTYVEVLHASVQCILAIMGVTGGIFLSKSFLEEDDTFGYMSGNDKSPRHTALQPMYVTYTSIPSNSSQSHIAFFTRSVCQIPSEINNSVNTQHSFSSSKLNLNKPGFQYYSDQTRLCDPEFLKTNSHERLPNYNRRRNFPNNDRPKSLYSNAFN